MADRNWKGKDGLGAAATLFALAVTFNAEYEIAIAVHIHPIVAYAVPGALDVYVLRALQVKRDVFLTVLAMVAVNAASHLVTAGVLAVSPALIVAVSAIAPLVLWRAHVLRHSVSTKPVVSPTPEHVLPCSQCGLNCAYPDRHDVPNVPEHVSEWRDDGEPAPAFEEHADQAVSLVSSETVNVPEDDDLEQIERSWLDKHIPEWDGNIVDATEHIRYEGAYDPEYMKDTGARVLSLVPPLPPEFPSVLEDGDKEFLDRARALPKLTFRALKELGMGNDRAARIKTYLESEHKEGRS